MATLTLSGNELSFSVVLAALLSGVSAAVMLLPLAPNVNAIIVNNTYFSIQVPNGWVYTENLLFDNTIILTKNEFFNVFNGDNPTTFLLNLVQSGVLLELGIDGEFGANNASLEKYVKYFLSNANEDGAITRNVTVGGENATKVFINGTEIGKTSPMKNITGSINSINYLVMHRGEPYYMYYIANENNFNKYLPQFEQIVKTFKFTKQNE